eukprot:m51a1_g13696 hypothetical protein (330) ;mRNA; f:33139-34386
MRVDWEYLAATLSEEGAGPPAQSASALFRLLYTPEGHAAFQRWSRHPQASAAAAAAPSSSSSTSSSPGAPSASPAPQAAAAPASPEAGRLLQPIASAAKMSETEFVGAVRRLTDLADHESLALFDLADAGAEGEVASDEWFVLVALLVAREARCCLLHLRLHCKGTSQLLAMLLAGDHYRAQQTSGSSSRPPCTPGTPTETSSARPEPEQTLSFARLALLGTAVGLAPSQVLSDVSALGVSVRGGVPVRDFELCAYAIMSRVDRRDEIASRTDVGSSAQTGVSRDGVPACFTARPTSRPGQEAHGAVPPVLSEGQYRNGAPVSKFCVVA